jgi:hypothetical protein
VDRIEPKSYRGAEDQGRRSDAEGLRVQAIPEIKKKEPFLAKRKFSFAPLAILA